MSSVDTSRRPQPTHLDAGTQTESPPLPKYPSGLETPACTCICSCRAIGSPPLPAVASTLAKRESKSHPDSDRSLLGRHPPRFNRLVNRIVSLPELAEEDALHERPFVQARVASMPGAFPPYFPDDMDDDESTSLDAIPLQALSGTVFTMQRDPRNLGFPQTPSPTTLRRDPGMVAFTDDGALFGERQSQDWVTWASSPPKPIPALHGPLSLPYARCPSGAEGTLIESDDRVSNVIWGLDNVSSRTQPQPEDSPLTEESPALSEFSPNLGVDPLYRAAMRLAQQMERLSTGPPGTPLLSPAENSLYLSGLGLDFKSKRYVEVDTLGLSARPTYGPQARGSRRVVSAGSLTVGTGDRLQPPSAGSPLLTPPLSAQPHWSPRLPSMLNLPNTFPVQVSGAPNHTAEHVRRGSLPIPSLDRFSHAQDWQARPNSNAPLALQRNYSIGNDSSIPSHGFDLHGYPSEGYSFAGQPGPVFTNREAPQKPKQGTPRSSDRMTLTGDDTKAQIPGRTLHRRLPVLEEDGSFTASPKQNARSSQNQALNIQVPERRAGPGMESVDELSQQVSGSVTTRSAIGPNNRRQTPVPAPRTTAASARTPAYTVPHRRAKQRKEM